METITVNSQDLGRAGTIDTYQTFDGGDVDDMMLQYYNEDNDTNYEYDDFEWTYDHKAIVTDIARERAYALEKYYDAIHNARPVEVGSPKYYNYSTDWADFEIQYDKTMVDAYIEDHKDDYKEWYSDSGWYSAIEWRENEDEKAELTKKARLDYYLNAVGEDSIIERMNFNIWERECEIYEEHTTMTPIKDNKGDK